MRYQPLSGSGNERQESSQRNKHQPRFLTLPSNHPPRHEHQQGDRGDCCAHLPGRVPCAEKPVHDSADTHRVSELPTPIAFPSIHPSEAVY